MTAATTTRLRLPAPTRRLADLIAIATTALVAGGYAMALPGSGAPIGAVAEALVFVLGFGGVGWLLATRVPHNPIGWSFSVGGLLWALPAFLDAIVAINARRQPQLDTFSRAAIAVLSVSWLWSMPFSVHLPLLLLPNGELLSRRWRPAVWALGIGAVVGTLGFATTPGVIENDQYAGLRNPMGITALGPLPVVLSLLGAALLGLAGLAGAVSLIMRFRRARGVERQQLRWVALGGAMLMLLAFAPNVLAGVFHVPDVLGSIGSKVGILSVPACVAIAVLRYRLYDLGRIVSRTASFAVVTALLFGVYLGLVSLSLLVLPRGSRLAVAMSTLAAAALFQPVRRRVQSAIDQRFNRGRYDADRTVAAFRRRLRDEVELDVVRADLLSVVHETLEPTRATLWLREAQ